MYTIISLICPSLRHKNTCWSWELKESGGDAAGVCISALMREWEKLQKSCPVASRKETVSYTSPPGQRVFSLFAKAAWRLLIKGPHSPLACPPSLEPSRSATICFPPQQGQTELNAHSPVHSISTLLGPQDIMPFPKMLLRSRPLTVASRPAFTCSPSHPEVHVLMTSTEGFLLVISQANYRFYLSPQSSNTSMAKRNSLKFPGFSLLPMLVLTHIPHHF